MSVMCFMTASQIGTPAIVFGASVAVAIDRVERVCVERLVSRATVYKTLSY